MGNRENKDYMLTPYGLIKEKLDPNFVFNPNERFLSHFFEYQNFVTHMFVYDNLPDTVDENFLEMYLTFNGTVGWTKEGGKGLIVIEGGRSEKIGLYGLGKVYMGTNNDPEIGTIKFEEGVNGVIGYNNSTMSPDFDFQFIPHLLTEIEKSILFNVRYARLAPIFEAANSKDQATIEKLLNDIDDGKMVNVISEDILQELEGGGTKTFNLTDVKEIDKLQYLIKAYEDILRIVHTKYGLSDHGSSKMAQQTVDEVNGSTSSAFSYALNALYYRRKMVEEVNAMFGTDITVRFSPAWELEYSKFIFNSEQTDDEYLEDAAEEGAEPNGEDSGGRIRGRNRRRQARKG
jgi:hypothetical protein